MAAIAEAISGIIGGIGDIGLGIYNAKNAEKWNQKNYELQQQALAENKAMNEYQKWFSQNSASIRAKDLANAGLSKTLAAGSSAQAPNLQQVQAAQRQFTPVNQQLGSQFLDTIYSSMLNASQVATSYEEQQNIRANTLRTMQDTAESMERTLGYKTDRDLKTLEYEIKNSAKQLYDNLNLPYNFNISNPFLLGQGLAMSGGKLMDYLKNLSPEEKKKLANESVLAAPDFRGYKKEDGLSGLGYESARKLLEWLFDNNNHVSVPK